jgi:hypothetical protein
MYSHSSKCGAQGGGSEEKVFRQQGVLGRNEIAKKQNGSIEPFTKCTHPEVPTLEVDLSLYRILARTSGPAPEEPLDPTIQTQTRNTQTSPEEPAAAAVAAVAAAATHGAERQQQQ